MAWTPELLSKTKQGEQIICKVRFTNGADTIERDVPTNTPNVSLPNFCARIIAELDKRDAAFAAATVGPITPATLDTDASPHVVFNRRYRKLLALKGLAPFVDPQLTTAMNNLQTQVEAYIKANPDAI